MDNNYINLNMDENINGTLLYENAHGFKVYMKKLNDSSKLIQKFVFFVVSPDNNISEIKPIKRSTMFTSKTVFDFVYDFMGDFDKDDIDNIKSSALKSIGDIKTVDIAEKKTFVEAHKMLCKYVLDNHLEYSIFIDDAGYCNINTEIFEDIVNELELGYKRLQLLRMFKVMNLLKYDKGRNDYRKYKDGREQYRVISFKYINGEVAND